jgi:hypothetical protein
VNIILYHANCLDVVGEHKNAAEFSLNQEQFISVFVKTNEISHEIETMR